MTEQKPDSTELDGLDEIAAHLRKSKSTLLRLIKRENFPAEKIGGTWASDKELIRSWRRQRIQERLQKRKRRREVLD